MNPRCDCGKDPHTYNGARKVMKQMIMSARRKGKTVHKQTPYKCPQGNQWHLTAHSYNIPKREAFTWLTN